MPISSVEAICNMALGYAGVRTRVSNLATEQSVAAQTCNTYYEQYRDDLMNDYKWAFTTRRVDLAPYSGSTWDSGTAYSTGQYVQYGANVYQATAAVAAGITPGASALWRQVTRDGWAYCSAVPADMIDEQYVYEKPSNSASSGNWPNSAHPIRAPRSDQRVPFAIEDANDGSGGQVILTDTSTPVLVYTARITNPQSFSNPFVKALAWNLSVPLCLALRADPAAAEVLKKVADRETAESVATELRGIREDAEPSSEFEAARES